MSSAPYQLATGDPVMAIGGFSGSDPAMTLTQFKTLVSEGKIHYYLADGRGMGGFRGFPGGGNVTSQITRWVQNSFKTVSVGGVTLYDLTQVK